MPAMSSVGLLGLSTVKNIRTTLMVGLFVSSILVGIMSLVSLNELRSLNLKLEDLVEASEIKTSLLYDMRIAARERNLHLMMTLILDDEFLIDEHWIKFREQGGIFLQAREEYKELALDDSELSLLDKQRALSVKAVELQYKLYDFVQAGNKEEALNAINETLYYQEQVFSIVDSMLEAQKSRNNTIVDEARRSQLAASKTVIVLGLSVIMLLVVTTVYIFRRISQQAELIENEGLKFQALIEGSMDAVLVLEEDCIIDANKNALMMFSVQNLKQLSDMGKRCLLRFRIDEKEENGITINEAIDIAEVGAKNRYHWYFADFDDDEISVDVEITAIDLRGRKLIQVVIRDVTEREIFQSALKELNENLETKVHERTEELKDLNSKIANIARSAGMAEVASGVLHNVGNVLNSINVSASVLKEQLKNCKAGNIQKISQLLNDNKDNLGHFMEQDEKGKFVLPYIEKLSEQIHEERDKQIKELECLGDNIEHIKTIISMQQSYAGSMGMVETMKASLLFDDAVKINISSLENNRVTLEYDFESDPEITIDKHKTVQVLVNFISNAKYALMNNDVDDRRMIIGIKSNAGEVEFYVQDNGVGIDPEHMGRLFEFGFKKREGGHGYGLHHSALMAKELKGRIDVQSDGKHQGARFSLVVPEK